MTDPTGIPASPSRSPQPWRRTLLALPALLALLFVMASCGGDETLRTETGIVLSVEATGLSAIDSFTLRTGDGRELVFDTTGTRSDAGGFPPQHLSEHRALVEPVKVTYQVRNGINEVVRLEDASP